MSRERLEALLNEAACIYDAPDMAQVAEHLIKNNVVVFPCAVGDVVYVLRGGEVEEQRVLGVKVGHGGTSNLGERWLCLVKDTGLDFYDTDIGVTVFFDYEQAEKVLARWQDENV